jgi:inorganic phosphate transporter, PiT family
VVTVLLLAVGFAALALAFANGANDNPKGVATLIGARRLGTSAAVRYATVMTLLGSVAALVLGKRLVARFTGDGVVAPELIGTPAFGLAVASAAAATVLLATRLGLPISTTHAIVGGLAGVGLATGSLQGAFLAAAFFGPLLLSPLLALGTTTVIYPVLRRLRIALGVFHQSCVCVAAQPQLVTAPAASIATSSTLRVVAGESAQCAGYHGTVAAVSAQRLLDGCHLLTAGAVSFARGVNDTPKVAALLLVAAPLGLAVPHALLLVGAAIAVGGLIASRRVATTMSFRITGMNDGQAFTANFTTALLVLVASPLGLPVATTHVSVGALFGIGALSGSARWKSIAAILASWVVVLPLAATLAALTWLVIGR